MYPPRVIASFALEAKQSRNYASLFLAIRLAPSSNRIALSQSLLAMTHIFLLSAQCLRFGTLSPFPYNN